MQHGGAVVSTVQVGSRFKPVSQAGVRMFPCLKKKNN